MRKCMTFILFVLFCVGGGAARAEMVDCTPQHAAVEGIAGVSLQRTVCADVVALDQTLVYNRFGSFNPFGMIFALRRDVVPAGMDEAGVDCDAADGTADSGAALEAGEVTDRMFGLAWTGRSRKAALPTQSASVERSRFTPCRA